MNTVAGLERLLEALPLAVVSFDETGRIHIVNGAARELLRAASDAVERALSIGAFLELDPTARPLPPIAYGPPGGKTRISLRLEELTALLPGRRTVVLRGSVASSEALRPHVAMLGHELRNPLAPLRLAARHLREHGAESATACLAIERNVEHLARIVNDLLDTERVAKGGIVVEQSPSLLVGAIRDALDACRPQFEEAQHVLSIDLDRLAGVELDADRVRLAQAFSNLLSNAATHTPHGGHIRLQAWLEGNVARLSLADDGPGLAKDSLESIFETFEQAAQPSDRPRGGLGLGLGLSRHIIERHGGTLTARSEGLGRGSTFVAEFPGARRAAVAPEATREPNEVAHSSAAAQTVLIVDDNEDAGAMLALVLESQGATCTVTHTGLQAVSALQGEQFDVAIVDIGLPDIDGFEVARRAHAMDTRPHRLVALSGYGQQSDRDAAQSAGFDDYYVKPLPPETLQTLLGIA